MAATSPNSKWTGPGLEELIVDDIWTAQSVAKIRADIGAKAEELGVDLTNPRQLLSDLALCDEIFPGASNFNKGVDWWQVSIKEFVH